jgi:hypothetical protein
MPELALTQEGKEALDAILGRRPRIDRAMFGDKIRHLLGLTIKAQGMAAADRNMVIEAARFVASPAFTPHLDAIENIEKYRERRGWKFDKAVYFAAPRRVKRWEPVRHKPVKPPQKMKVLAFNSSPRAGGNTDILMDEALRGASEAGAQTEKYILQKLNIQY